MSKLVPFLMIAMANGVVVEHEIVNIEPASCVSEVERLANVVITKITGSRQTEFNVTDMCVSQHSCLTDKMEEELEYFKCAPVLHSIEFVDISLNVYGFPLNTCMVDSITKTFEFGPKDGSSCVLIEFCNHEPISFTLRLSFPEGLLAKRLSVIALRDDPKATVAIHTLGQSSWKRQQAIHEGQLIRSIVRLPL